jgi:hypothetical protein
VVTPVELLVMVVLAVAVAVAVAVAAWLQTTMRTRMRQFHCAKPFTLTVVVGVAVARRRMGWLAW